MDPGAIASIAQNFATQYYQVFDTNRAALGNFYHEQSLLNFEANSNEWIFGKDKIVEKILSLPFQSVHHAITTIDAQPTTDNGLLVVVNGQLKTDDDPKMAFTQTFYLKQQNGSMFVNNDIFRLGVHNF